MNDIEYILDFAAALGSRMLAVGANLERVDDTMSRVCRSYHLDSVSIFSISSMIIISAKSENGLTGSRQVSVPPANNHLEKLNRYNQLSRTVCAQTPPPRSLTAMLEEAEDLKDYSLISMILGHLLAMTGICVIFGGTLKDVISADINTLILFGMIRFLGSRNLNHIIINTFCMWIVGTLAILFVKFGIGEQLFVIIISNSMIMIPGIPLVNAVRNILCGNEMNGILEFLKVVLETIAIVLGLFLSIYMFGGLIQW